MNSVSKIREAVDGKQLIVRERADVKIFEVIFCDACEGGHEDLRFRHLDEMKWYGHCPKTKKPLIVTMEAWVD